MGMGAWALEAEGPNQKTMQAWGVHSEGDDGEKFRAKPIHTSPTDNSTCERKIQSTQKKFTNQQQVRVHIHEN